MLTERRKADRIKMAEAVRALAVECGAAAEVEDRPYGDLSPREIVTRIQTARGLCLSVGFDGDSPQPDIYVLSWYVGYDAEAKSFYPVRLSKAFGDINPHHRRKSTDIAEGFDALCECLRYRLGQCASGAAYFDAEAA